MKGKAETMVALMQNHWKEDRNVTSELLNLLMTFHWRKMVVDNFTDIFREWNTPPYSSTPNFIVMGIYNVQYLLV